MTVIQGIEAKELLAILDGLKTEIKALKSAPVPTVEGEEYLTRHQTAALLDVSLVTIHDWTNKGILLSYRLGNRVYYKRSEIDAAMTQITRKKAAYGN